MTNQSRHCKFFVTTHPRQAKYAKRVAPLSLFLALTIWAPVDRALAQRSAFQSVTDALKKAASAIKAPATSGAQQNAGPAQPPAQPLSSSAQTAAPAHLAANSAGADVFTPPSADSAAAPAGPLDPSKMPQINGIHLGMPMADAKVALQKLYPNAHIDALNGMVVGPQHQSLPWLLRVQADSSGLDASTVDTTSPPNAQLVWHMARNSPQPHVAHDVLVAALRAKYGKETLALGTTATDNPATVDGQILLMYWVYDQQGHLQTSTKIVAHSPFGCGHYADGANGNLYSGLVRNPASIPVQWCLDNYVVVSASLGPKAILDILYLDMVDLPLAVRSAKATAAWAKGLDAQAQQQATQKANAAQPTL